MAEYLKEYTNLSKNNQIVDKFLSLKREAFSNLDQALNFDSNNNSNELKENEIKIKLYEKCSKLIESALNFYTENKKIRVLDDLSKNYNELLSIKKQTDERLVFLKNKNSFFEEFLNLEEEILNSDNDYLIIDANEEKPDNNLKNYAKADEILRIEDGVQIFYISNNGTVTTPSPPTSLSVYSFENGEESKKLTGFIQVGSWLYPLIPNESPGMKTNFNAFIFPNNTNNDQESIFTFVGLTFSDKISNKDKKFFEEILISYNSLIYQDKNESSNAIKNSVLDSNEQNISKNNENETNADVQSWNAEGIAQKILDGAHKLTRGVSTTTDFANKHMKKGGEKIKANLDPNTEPLNIDPKMKSLFQNLQNGTHVTVRVSNYFLNKLTSIANSTAKIVSPHIKQGSTAILAKSGLVGNKSNAKNYVDNACTLAHSSMQGFGLVYDSLEQAAKILGKSFTEQTVDIVEHKYGSDAAKITQNGMYSIGNVAVSVNNFKNFKIVRTLAKETAKEAISSSKLKNSNDK